MGNLDEEIVAKLRAMKNKMLGRDENDNSIEDKNKEARKPLIKTTHTFTVERKVDGKKYIEEHFVERVEPSERHKKSIERDKYKIKNKDIFTPKTEKALQIRPTFDEDIDLCIGLDIGTSTTKAVIKQVYTENNVFYVVDFAEYGIEGQEYLIPTYLCENNDIFSLPKYNMPYTHTNLKLNFIEKQKNADIQFRAYIALVIQYIKNWFEEKHGNDDIVKNKNIIWQVNLGIPSAQFNDEGDNAKFLKVLKEAYYLSNFPKISTKSPIVEENKVELNIVPEIIASIQSYIKRNDISHEGLYCVSDIGAGTLDICTFRVKEDDMGNVVYSFFKSKVERLGTKEYQASLLKYKESLIDLVLNKETEIQQKNIGCMVTNNSEYLIIDEIKQQQKKDIEKYKNTVTTCFCNVLFPTYQTRDPNAREWVETLPLAVGGGGISIPFYQKVIQNDLTDWLKKYCGDHQGHKRCQGFRSVDIKGNQKNFISDCHNIDCARLAVALGLSYPINDFDDIRKYYKEYEIEDIEVIAKVNTDNNYISKDQV